MISCSRAFNPKHNAYLCSVKHVLCGKPGFRLALSEWTVIEDSWKGQCSGLIAGDSQTWQQIGGHSLEMTSDGPLIDLVLNLC